MRKHHTEQAYTPEDYRRFIDFLLIRIEDVKILRTILAIVNDIFCKT